MTDIYLAGPITGRPDYREAFAAASDAIAQGGLRPVSPLQIGEWPGWTWADYMRAAIPLMLTCEGVALLPGWDESRGARMEARTALALGMPVATVRHWRDWATPRAYRDGVLDGVAILRSKARTGASCGGWESAATLVEGLI